MNKDYFVICYKKNEDSDWLHQKAYMSFAECLDYCKARKYFKHFIYNPKDYNASDLFMYTDITLFENEYYIPEEQIPYPKTEPVFINDFPITFEWEDETDFFPPDYDEVYNNISEFSTEISVNILIDPKIEELGIDAKTFIQFFPKFLDKLENDRHAVYSNIEFSPYKWLCWIIEDKVRLIHQNYRFNEVKTEFDVLMDKKLFFDTAKNMLKIMQDYYNKDIERYRKYIEKNYEKKQRKY